MISLPRLSRMLKKVFVQEANTLARQMGVIQRERVFSGASLLHLLVFGWLTQPQGGRVHWPGLPGRWACG